MAAVWALSGCAEWGTLSVGHMLLTVAASPGVKLGLYGVGASVVVAHGLGCSAACGIFPDEGLKASLLHWQVDSLPLNH